MPDTIIIYSKEVDEAVTVLIAEGKNIRPDEGFILFPENKCLLGSDLYGKFREIKNNSNALEKMFSKLKVIQRNQLPEKP